MMYWKAILLSSICVIGLINVSDARMPEPSFMPQALKGGEPHNPNVATYYLQELVMEGKMTKEEAERTEVYLIFRYARRMQDYKDVEGLSEDERRAVMANKRELRGNPLVEYANYCGLSLERAKILMNFMHGSDKGSWYFKEMNHGK